MDGTTLKRIHKAITLLREHAVEIKRNAEMAGQPHDGGARNLIDQVDAYIAGLGETIPAFINPYYEQVLEEERLDNDPEYVKYLELKKKFEDV